MGMGLAPNLIDGILLTCQGEFYQWLPPLGDFMPIWGYALIALSLFCIASFETAFRYIRSIQPPLIVEIRNLLLRRQTEGFSIRKKRGDGWEAKAFDWYNTVLKDLTLIFGKDYSTLFDAELGRKPGIKMQNGGKNPKLLITNTSDMLTLVMERDLVESKISPHQELKKRLLDALSE